MQFLVFRFHDEPSREYPIKQLNTCVCICTVFCFHSTRIFFIDCIEVFLFEKSSQSALIYLITTSGNLCLAMLCRNGIALTDTQLEPQALAGESMA